ncbi:RND superfamily putative drug exporter [Krasilnikovia cinnamomea]|uniref:RND superfamily putative drug exporter n=1 Tax=Krasilnikovia cinnamomea TaxID=349313 RepID=A0A4V2G7Z3_9ACTN|nr:MMPL family transporter [Krasilnikovia cinnamomea]RZU54516.1 RND superfamily putative drug exporter [Krasilnikovia cinnamomea]
MTRTATNTAPRNLGRRVLPRPGFAAWGRMIGRHRRLVLGLWLVAVLAGVPALSQLSDNLTAGGFEVPGSGSARVAALEKQALPQRFDRTSVLVVHSDRTTIDDPGYAAALTRVRAALAASPGVAEVSDPLTTRQVSPDRRTAVVEVGINEPQDAAYAHAPELQEAVDRALQGTPADGAMTGDAPFYAAFQETGSEDLATAERIVLPLVLAILLLALGSAVAALLPLALAGIAASVGLALISVLAANTTVNIFTQNLATMIAVGVGVDYALFVLRPFRRALAQGLTPQEAVGEALGNSGHGVLVSALTVVVALAGTQLVDVPAYRSMGLGAMIAVAVAAAAALTLFPAMLAMLGTRVNALRLPGRLGRRTYDDEPRAGRLRAVVGLPVRRPWWVVGATVALLALLALPALHLRLGTSGPDILAADAAPRVAAQRLADGFGAGRAGPLRVLVAAPSATGGRDAAPIAPDTRAGVERVARALSARLHTDPEVVDVAPPQIGADGRVAALTVATKHGPQSAQVIDLVHRLRATLPEVAGAGTTVLVGGEPAQNVDLNAQVGGSVPKVIALVLVLSFVLLMVAFRSLPIALKAVVTNLASVLAVYGVLVWVFQDGHGASLLGVQAPGYVEVFLPLFLFCILFGLSMDYEVFLLTAVRRAHLDGYSTKDAVVRAVTGTAGVIGPAAAIMIVVFGGFAFTTLIPIQAIGFGLAVAVLLDVSVVRLLLVPATLVLLGERNWWLPKWLAALLPPTPVKATVPDQGVPGGPPTAAGPEGLRRVAAPTDHTRPAVTTGATSPEP